MSTTQKKGGIHYGFVMVVACCLMCLSAAISWNCAGIFFAPVVKELGIMRGSLALYLTVMALTTSIFLPVAGRLLEKVNNRILLVVMAIINAVAIGAMGTHQSVMGFYLSGVGIGIPQAFFLYLVGPTMMNRWFAKKTGFFTGICMAFSGIFAVILNPIGGYVIATYGWRTAYMFFGALILVICVPAALLVKDRPSMMGLQPYGYDEAEEAAKANANKGGLPGITFSAAIKTLPFVLFVAWAIVQALYNDVNSYLPSYATSLGFGIAISSTIGSMTMLGSVISKIGLGAVNDKSVVGALLVAGTAAITGVALMTFAGPSNPTLLLAGALLWGICHANVTVQIPLVVRKVFGPREYTQILAVIMMVVNLASSFGQSLWGYVADANGGSFYYSMVSVLGCAFLVSVISVGAYLSRKRLSWIKEQEMSSLAAK